MIAVSLLFLVILNILFFVLMLIFGPLVVQGLLRDRFCLRVDDLMGMCFSVN